MPRFLQQIIIVNETAIPYFRNLISEIFGHKDIEIRTVDGFQGREKEIVVIRNTVVHCLFTSLILL